MRDILAIQSDNRRAAIRDNDIELWGAFIELIGKVKAAGWKEESFRRAEDIVTKIEKSATGRDNVKVKPA